MKYDGRIQNDGVPKVVGLRSLPGVHSGSNRYVDGSYIVFLDRRNANHIKKLMDFVKTLNEQERFE